jgi:cell division septum initiation protein DivIVA
VSIFRVLDKIENAIYASQKLPGPFRKWSVINSEKFLALIEKSRVSLPEEMKHARWIAKENQRILQEAQEKADRLLKEAKEQQRQIIVVATEERNRMLDENEIVIKAKEKAEDVVRNAESYAGKIKAEAEITSKEIRQDADDYAYRVLSGLEKELGRIMDIIQKSKQSLVPNLAAREADRKK